MNDGIHRPDWGDGGFNTIHEEHVVGLRSTPVGRIERPDWGRGGDHRQNVETHVKGPSRLPEIEGAVPLERSTLDETATRVGGEAEPEAPGAKPDSDQALSGEIDPVVSKHLTSFMEKGGADPKFANAALQWLESVQGKDLTKELKNTPVRHAYDFRQVELSGNSRDLLNAYANHMAKAGASQQEVMLGIEWYEDIQKRMAAHERQQGNANVDARREVEALDIGHRDRGAALLRNEWQGDYEANIALMNQHFDSLPKDEQQRLANARNEETGVRLLNDPEFMREFLGEARANQQDDGLSRKEIEQIMRTNRREYDRDPALQARYRNLLRQSD